MSSSSSACCWKSKASEPFPEQKKVVLCFLEGQGVFVFKALFTRHTNLDWIPIESGLVCRVNGCYPDSNLDSNPHREVGWPGSRVKNGERVSNAVCPHTNTVRSNVTGTWEKLRDITQRSFVPLRHYSLIKRVNNRDHSIIVSWTPTACNGQKTS